MVHVWTVGEEATFTGSKQAALAILSRVRPHTVYGEWRNTLPRVLPRHVDRRLGTRVDIVRKARESRLPAVDRTCG